MKVKIHSTVSYLFIFITLINCSKNENIIVDEVDEMNTEGVTSSEDSDNPPFEIFFFDQIDIPDDRGVPGTSYTAKVFVLDNIQKIKFGPYRGSTHPNSKELLDSEGERTDRPNSVSSIVHLFNNKNGHKGKTQKGLNLINSRSERLVDGYSWSKKDVKVKYANVHSGFSDKGNYNSRGSLGCPTIHPEDVDMFMSHFDFSIPNRDDPNLFTMGNSEGVIHILRTNDDEKNILIEEMTLVYE